VLVPAHLLVNGRSIVREPAGAAVEYLHLELDAHDIILAEGAPAESFVDDDSRALFDNAAGFRLLYPHDTPRPPAFRAPRITGGPALVLLRTRLERIAGTSPGPLRGGLDRADREVLEGWAHDPRNPDAPAAIEVVVDGRVVGAALADRFRDDLARFGLGRVLCVQLDLAAAARPGAAAHRIGAARRRRRGTARRPLPAGPRRGDNKRNFTARSP